jgi:hypothetical protein
VPSRFEQLALAFVNTWASELTYTVVANGSFGWTLTGTPSIPVRILERSIAEGSRPPAIYIHGLGSSIEPADRVGGGKIGATDRGRILVVRNFTMRHIFWGANIEQAEQMLHNAIAIWWKVAHASLLFSDEVWIDQQEGEDSWDKLGSMLSLNVQVKVPVYATLQPLTVVTSTDSEDTFAGEGEVC